jgi:hypothetical protein
VGAERDGAQEVGPAAVRHRALQLTTDDEEHLIYGSPSRTMCAQRRLADSVQHARPSARRRAPAIT